MSATADVRAVAGAELKGTEEGFEGSFSVTESAPASPTKQHAGRRGVARLFRGGPAGPPAPTARGLADLVPRSSSAAELLSRPPSAVSLDPVERHGLGRLGRLLGRKRPAEEASLPASPAASVVTASDGDAADGSAAQQHRPRLFAGLRKRLHKP